MLLQIIEAVVIVLALVGLAKIFISVGQNASPEDVMNLLGDSLTMKGSGK
jgi:hypothetical protein